MPRIADTTYQKRLTRLAIQVAERCRELRGPVAPSDLEGAAPTTTKSRLAALVERGDLQTRSGVYWPRGWFRPPEPAP